MTTVNDAIIQLAREVDAGETTPEAFADFISFRNIARMCWDIPSKAASTGYVKFKLRPAQKLIDNEYRRQMDERGYVRLNVLKCRQAGVSTYFTRRALWYVMRHDATAAISIAHEKDLPTIWLAECQKHVAQTPSILRPKPVPARGARLAFANGSNYEIGSAQGGFPAMGRTIPYQHKSELGRWDKLGVGQDPDRVLIPAKPAMPSGDYIKDTVDVHESTGVMIGDWWHQTWMAGKRPKSKFKNLFIPWYLVPEYKREDLASDVLSLSPYEQQTAREAAALFDVSLSHPQIAWYRDALCETPYYGNELAFRAEYPANEDESFMTEGLAQYTAEMAANARKTQREPIWKGNILPDPETDDPARARFEPNPAGEVFIWEWPDKRYHYLLGADSMWGKSAEGTDFDCLHVERLELDPTGTFGPLCAKVRGKWPLSQWAWFIKAMGYKFNACTVAPEVTGQASAEGTPVMSSLLGETSEYRYPNIWVRTGKTTLRPRVEDYGWDTNHNTKGTLLLMSQGASLDGTLDWCDEGAIKQMMTIIRDKHAAIMAPPGLHDDDWMSRVITAEVARRERFVTDLYVEPAPASMAMRTPEQRMIESDREFREEAYGLEDGDDPNEY